MHNLTWQESNDHPSMMEGGHGILFLHHLFYFVEGGYGDLLERGKANEER